MTTYTLDTHATIREFQEAGMDPRQAEVVVAAISRSDAELVTKADLKAEIAAVKADISEVKSDIDKLEASTKAEIVAVKAELKQDIANLKAEVFRALWIQGAGLVGIQLAIGALLFAAIRFLILKQPF